MEALARLSGSVAHDFNNLLTVMMASAELLRHGRPAADRTGPLDDLNAAIDRATELAQSLLAFGRRQVGRLQAIDLNASLRTSARMLRRALGETFILELVPFESEPLWVRGDPGQLELILLNLCLNARDAAPTDGVIRVGVGKAELGADDVVRPAELEPGTYAELYVSDCGHGMTPEIQSQVFEPFFTTKSEGRGTGLGLASVHGIVTGWGGGIKVESVLLAGTTMRVFLPLAREASLTTPPPRPASGHVGGRETLLLVEDEPLLRRAASRALQELGYRVFSFASAEDLEEALEECAAQAALLISDVRLPGMDGVQLAGRVKEGFPLVRVLLISGHVELPHQQEIIQSGKYNFLPKPFSVEGLARRIREILD